MTWTPERTETLIALYTRGWSRGAIAIELGVTRNAIIGKINRLKAAGTLGEQPVCKPRKPRKAGTPARASSSIDSAGRVVSPAGPAEKRQSPSAPPCEGELCCPAPDQGPTIPPAPDQGPTIPPAPDQGPTAAVNSPSIACDAAGTVSHLVAVEGLSVSLVEANADQCRFPIWPHTALPDHPDYGQVCGAQVKPSKPGQPVARYCVHHHRVVTGERDETRKAKDIVRATVRQARAQGVA